MGQSGFPARPVRSTGSGIAADLAAMLSMLRHDLFGGYHPERHYMRGPGPKWHEKHPGEAYELAPQRVRVR